MASTKKTETTIDETKETKAVEKDTDLVEYYAPISREMQKDIFVCVNGHNLKIKRGEKVMIPRWAKKVLDQSEDMDKLAFQRSMGMRDTGI